MANLEEQIKQLKSNSTRDNYYYMRRRIDKGNGKKTLGWIMENDDAEYLYESKDFNVLHEQMIQMENANAWKTIYYS